MTVAGRTHLVLIDLQRIFAAGPWAAPRFAETIAPVHRLVAAFDGAAIFTRFVAPAVPEGAWTSYYKRWPFAHQPPDAPEFRLVDEVAGLAGAAGTPVDATTFGKWPGVRDRGGVRPGDHLVVGGVSTDCCVISTVLAAVDAGVAVTVAADACAGVDDDSHAKALDVMALYAPLVEVRSADEVIAGRWARG